MELMRCSSLNLNRSSLCCRGTTINHLPDVLLIEIFLRLPLKSTKLCTVVCNYWYALISNSDFSSCFFQLNYTSTLLISCKDSSRPRNNKLYVSENSVFRSNYFSLPCLPCGSSVAVVASCGDLLLCCHYINLHSVYYICNPFTGKWLPLPPTCTRGSFTMHTGFLFECQGNSFKYAVVRFPCPVRGGAVKFEILTSDSGYWSEKVWTQSQNVFRFPFENLAATPYKGMLFWISSYVADKSDILVGVNPFSEGEHIHFIDLPPRPTKFVSQELAVCRGILKLLETEMNDSKDALSIRVWDLKDFGENEWDLKHHINFWGLQYENPSWFEYDEPEVFPIAWDSNNDDDIMYVAIDGKVVLLCNMNKQTLDVIHECDDHMFHCGSAFVCALPWQPTAIPSLLNADNVA